MKNYTQILVLLISFVISSQSFKLVPLKSQKNQIENDFSNEEKKCNATHFEFYGLKYFMNEQQIKFGIQSMNKNYSSLKSVSYGNYNDENSYDIYPTGNYIYKNPNGTIRFISNQTMRIEGGFIEAQVQFRWYHRSQNKPQRSGTGKAFGVSSQIPYSIKLNTYWGILFSATDFTAPKFDQLKLISLQIEDEDIYPITDEERFVITYMLNKLPEKSVIINLQENLNQPLVQCIYRAAQQGFPSTEEKSYYIWNSTCNQKQLFGAFFTRSYTIFENNNNSTYPGVYLGYQSRLEKYDDQICGPQLPQSFADPTKYGSNQEFISLTYLQNILNLGIIKGQFNTTLKRQNWGTKSFKFTMKEMSFIFSNITENFYQFEQVEGFCQPDPTSLKIFKGTNTTLNITMTQKCTLRIRDIKIVELALSLNLQIEGKPMKSELNFWLNSYSSTVTYNDSFGFKMLNKVLADVNMRETLNRLYEVKLFGSGFQLAMQRTRPSFAVLDTAILIYELNK